MNDSSISIEDETDNAFKNKRAIFLYNSYIVEVNYEKPYTEQVWEWLLDTPNLIDFKKVYLKKKGSIPDKKLGDLNYKIFTQDFTLRLYLNVK